MAQTLGDIDELHKAYEAFYKAQIMRHISHPPPTTEQRITNIERMLTELLDLLKAQ